MPETVMVTGAGGFIGGHVARLLAGQPSLAVRGGTRDGRMLGAGISPCRLDVTDATSLDAGLAGVDMVVHCAVGDRATTVDGTARLLLAARQARVRHVVHLSSIAVYGETAGVVREDSRTISAVGGGYAAWKMAAEQACAAATRDGLPVTILRPAIVYGPGSDLWVTQPARRLLSGSWPGLGDLGRGTCNLVHVADVANACLAALQAPGIEGAEAFNIAGPQAVTWAEWYDRLRMALDLPREPALSEAAWRRRSMAALPCKAAARMLPAAGRLFARRMLVAPARAELVLFALTATYPTDKAARVLGWQPAIGLDQGVADSIAWLRASELAPPAVRRLAA